MSDTETVAPSVTRKQALLGSLEAVKETAKLLTTGHFAGNRAAKIIGCLGYLDALQKQIEQAIKEDK